MSDWVIHEGDCLDILPTLASGSIDAVITDPPYGMSNRTNSKRFTGGNRIATRGEGRDDWPEVKGDAVPFDPTPWLAFPKAILWGANHFAARLPTGTTLVWIKRADHLFGTFLSDAEIGWMKGGHGVYCHREQFPPPCRMEEAGGPVAHPNQKPIGLMRWCIARLGLQAGDDSSRSIRGQRHRGYRLSACRAELHRRGNRPDIRGNGSSSNRVGSWSAVRRCHVMNSTARHGEHLGDGFQFLRRSARPRLEDNVLVLAYLWASGIPAREIARRLGVPRDVILRWKKRLGLQPRGASYPPGRLIWTREKRAAVRKAVCAGLTDPQGAASLGVTTAAFAGVRWRMGLKRKQKAGAA